MAELQTWIWWAGWAQWSVLVASALVPIRLEWRTQFQQLPRLHRQLFWTYGGYVVLAIVVLGLLCVSCSPELASGGKLPRFIAGYMAVFWGVRLLLQLVLDVRGHLTTWWLQLGYGLLTIWFLAFTVLFGGVAAGLLR